MGQRATILIKRNFADGSSSVDMLHHQWAYGKILPAYFMQEVLRMNYDMDKKASYQNYGRSMRNTGYMSFAELKKGGLDYHYILDGQGNEIFDESGIEDYNKVDVWNIQTIKELCNKADNNNGGMIVEVTEKAVGHLAHKEDIEVVKIKIGFLLGEEECRAINQDKDFEGEQEQPFSRIVTAREYMERTGGKIQCPKCSIVMFEKFLKTFEVEQMGENEKAKVD